jgi:sigma-E factor negative regulatory protein RseA
MDKISQLMDGELGRRESEAQIRRLESDESLLASWETYHLIGDTLRHETGLTTDFARQLHQRLGREPAVLAPHMRPSHRVVRYTLPLAAGVAGVTLVAWLALSFQQAGQQASPTVANAGNAGVMSDYLTAHQEFSPSTAMHGVASYVRTVSNDESVAR